MPKQRIYVHSDTAGTEAARERHTNQTKHTHHGAHHKVTDRNTAKEQHQGNHRRDGESHAQVPLEDNQPEHGETHQSKAHKLVFSPRRGGLLVGQVGGSPHRDGHFGQL